MSDKYHKKIITISGAHSGVGKPRVAATLLRKLKGWSALKVILSHNGPCPKGKPCGACDDLNSKFSIIENKDVVETKGKDTGRLKAAGAEKVLWLKATPEGLREGLKKAMARFNGAKGIIVEGTSVLKWLKPDLAIFVRGKESALKPSAKEAIKKADLILTV